MSPVAMPKAKGDDAKERKREQTRRAVKAWRKRNPEKATLLTRYTVQLHRARVKMRQQYAQTP